MLNFKPTVNQDNAHTIPSQYIAFVNANGGIHKWSLMLNQNAFTKDGLFGGVNQKGTLWQPMVKAQQSQNSVAGALLWACVNGVDLTKLPTSKTTCPKVHAKLVSMVIPKKAKPVPLAQIHAISQLSGSGVLSSLRQNVVSAILIGRFSLLKNGTYGTNFGHLVPNAS